jgi:hypothetical protein
MALVLDAGGLIAVERRDRTVVSMLRIAQQEGLAVRTSAGAVAQVWRAGGRQATLARVLTGVNVAALDGASARRMGELLAKTRGSDVVDAHVGLLVNRGDTVLTSDADDIAQILRSRGVTATVHSV